jgi:hypothetical protein
VRVVIKVMKLKMVFVLPLIFLIQKIKDANLGKMESVLNAQQDGILLQTNNAIQLMIYAELGMMLLELVNHVIMDILSKMENV